MAVRFGVSPIAWANDDMPELGGDTAVETILADAAALGFEGVELGGRFPRDPAVLGPTPLARRGTGPDRRLVLDGPADPLAGGGDRRPPAHPSPC